VINNHDMYSTRPHVRSTMSRGTVSPQCMRTDTKSLTEVIPGASKRNVTRRNETALGSWGQTETSLKID
jgi:hypothetical protein